MTTMSPSASVFPAARVWSIASLSNPRRIDSDMVPGGNILAAFFTKVANNVATVTASSADSVKSRSAWIGGGAFETDDDAPEVDDDAFEIGGEELDPRSACSTSGGILAISCIISSKYAVWSKTAPCDE